jgi:hypothetical protein
MSDSTEGVFSQEEVWMITDALQVGSTIQVEWRQKGKGKRFKASEGEVLRASCPSGAGSLRYAAVRFERAPGPSMFPEDGANGTLALEYRVIDVEDPIEFTPSPMKEAAMKAVSRRPQEARCTDANDVRQPRAVVLAEKRRNEEEFGECYDDPDAAPEEVQDFHSYRYYLDPATWDLVVPRDIDVLKAQLWMRSHFADLSNSKLPAENFIFADLLECVCDDLASVRQHPEHVTSSHWVLSRERLLARMILQVDRINGATAAQLNACQRGFKERHQPQWLQQTRERGAQLLAHPDFTRPTEKFRSGKKEWKRERKKE